MHSHVNAVKRVRVFCNPLPDVGENFVGSLLSLQHLDWNSPTKMWIRLLEPLEGSAPVSPNWNRQFENLREFLGVRIPGLGLDGRFTARNNTRQLTCRQFIARNVGSSPVCQP